LRASFRGAGAFDFLDATFFDALFFAFTCLVGFGFFVVRRRAAVVRFFATGPSSILRGASPSYPAYASSFVTTLIERKVAG